MIKGQRPVQEIRFLNASKDQDAGNNAVDHFQRGRLGFQTKNDNW